MPAKSGHPEICPATKPLSGGDGDIACELTPAKGETALTRKLHDLRNSNPLGPRWKSLPVVFESCSPTDDFYLFSSGTFAVSERARRLIESLAGDSVEFLPLEPIGIRDEDDGPVRKLPRAQQRKLFVVRPLELAKLSKDARFEDFGPIVLVQRYAFDWNNLDDRHWFRAAGVDATLVSAQLRAAVEKAGLKGIKFGKPIKYALSGQRQAASAIKVPSTSPPTPPDFGHLAKTRQVTKSLWQNWVDHWNWVCDAIAARDGDVVERPKIAKPLSDQKLTAVKKRMGIDMPREFEDVLRNYSARVSFFWFVEDEQAEALPETLRICSGGSDNALWDVANLAAMSRAARDHAPSGWLSFRDGLRGRLPFIGVGNGDVIAFDMRRGTSNCPIVYLSHENDPDAHDAQLADNLIDFVTRWSYLGGPNVDYHYLAPFYDRRAKRLKIDGANAKRWRKWLESGE
jgi:hypothetical protein